jgi:hypothetical protein
MSNLMKTHATSKSLPNPCSKKPLTRTNNVIWTSQSAGYRKEKHGKIIAVVPPNTIPEDCMPPGYTQKYPFGIPRSHTSFLIAIGNSKKLYWPHVSLLKKTDV